MISENKLTDFDFLFLRAMKIYLPVKTKHLLFMALAVVLSLPMNAKVWYVSSTAGSDSSPNDGTFSKPYATFMKAYGVASSSVLDTINVSGTFNEKVGTATKSFSLQGNDKNSAIFDGASLAARFLITYNTPGLTINIENVTFKNYNNYDPTGPTTGAALSFLVYTISNIKNVIFQDNTGNLGGAIRIAASTEGTTSILIQDCYFKNNYAQATTSGTVHHGQGGALDIYTTTFNSSITINRCLFESNTAQGSNGSAIAYASTADSGTAAASLIIQNSTFTANAITYSTEATPVAGEAAIFLNANGTGIDVSLINNTIAYNTSAKTTASSSAGFKAAAAVANVVTLINNILFSNFNAEATPVSTSIFSSALLKESRNNITDVASGIFNWTTKTTAGMYSGNVNSVVNGSSVGQLGLAANAAALADNGGATKTLAITSANSVAIGTGYATGVPSVDQRIANRSTVDIGAYEYNSTPLYVPAAPTVNGASISSLNVTINENNNLSDVVYAIQETTGLKYVQADGTLGAAAVWQTASVWGTKTVTGLTFNTTYSFAIKASRSSIESPFGTAINGVTRVANITFYVKPSGGSQWSGKSSQLVQSNLTTAISTAVAGDQIWVASGTYTSPSGGFVMKDGVNVLGGFDGTEVVSTGRKPLTNKTILDGNFANKVLTQGTAGFTNRTKWDGFIMQNGNSTNGACIAIGQNATLANCVIRNNTSTSNGGAVEVDVLTGTAFDALTDATNNRAWIINCMIHNNTANAYGGGIFLKNNTIVVIANTVIVNNSILTSSGQGGVSNGTGTTFTFTNCILWGNMNNTAVTPTASQTPFGFATFNTSAVQGLSSVLVDLDAANSGSTPGAYYPEFTTPSTTIGSNASSLPSDIAASDWSLLSTSACVDKGVNSSLVFTFPTTDLVGNIRQISTKVDLGAVEYQAITSSATTITACTTTYGTASSAQTITVTGSYLTSDIIATAPTGFEVSNNGSTYATTASFSNSGGSASGTLYIRLAATATVSGTYNSQNIVLSSTNCTSVNIVTAASGNAVTAKALTVSGATTANKGYDGVSTAAVTGGSLVGVVSPDVVTLTQEGTYSDKNVGTSKAITANCSIGGADAGNYTLTQPVLTARDITAIALTIGSPSIASKVYNGTLTSGSVTSGSLSGFVGSETVTVNTAVGTYADANVGNGKTATIVYTLANGTNGGLAANYSLANGSATGNITLASQTITFDALTNKQVPTSDYSPGATSISSGVNTITYTSSAPAVATIVSGLIHIVGVGTTNITASQAASANYSVAADVVQSLTVDAVAPQTISSNTPPATHSDLTDPSLDLIVTGVGTTLTLGASRTVKSLTLAAGAKVNFTGAYTLTVTNDLLLKADDTNSFSMNLDDGTLSVGGEIKYQKTIDDSKWFFMAFPADVTIADITATNTTLGVLGVDWFIRYYNGSQRGTSGTADSNWMQITDADIVAAPALKLNKYQGYIVGLKDGKPNTELSFVLKKTDISHETVHKIPVAENTGATAATHHGWNLIGQPYLSNFDASGATGADSYFMYLFDGAGYTAYDIATAPDLPPMSAYFVQASNTLAIANTAEGITFALNKRQNVRATINSNLADRVQLNLTSTTGTDQTTLIVDDVQSADFQIGKDLEKWMTTGTSKPQLYTSLNGLNFAYNTLPSESAQNLPLGFYSKTAGAARISADVSRAAGLTALLLEDKTTNVVTDLLSSDYNFTAASGTNSSRFLISVKKDVATHATSLIKDPTALVDSPTISVNNGKVTVTNLSGENIVKVFDVTAREIVSISTSGSSIDLHLPLNNSIYIIQVISKFKTWTTKVVF